VSIDKDIASLERVQMLRALGRSALRMIAMGAEPREMQPGDVLFRPGDRIDSAYVVQQGTFQLTADPAQTGKVIEVGPGTLLGEFALLAEAAQPLTATAVDHAVVTRISRSMFLRILEDDVGAAVRLRDYVAQRARQSIAEVLEVRYTLDPEDR
jgi:CRP-like cAMP-binding protein